jgi:hypothetical protein
MTKSKRNRNKTIRVGSIAVTIKLYRELMPTNGVFLNPDAWILANITFLEIVLGIDNIIHFDRNW